MKYLNLGCGAHYSIADEWVNLDFEAGLPGVIGHNLLKGIPYPDGTFDFVYHSHVLEHFSKADGELFVSECFRVLKKGGILRVVIPDLERIAKEYIKYLELGMMEPDNSQFKANYNWILLEMYDQTVRNFNGGNLAEYILQESIPNEDYLYERIGEEGRSIRKFYLENKTSELVPAIFSDTQGLIRRIKNKIREYLLDFLKIDMSVYEVGKFRMGGQIHQWMYDRYSLTNLMKEKGGDQIIVKDAFSSYLSNWEIYSLDGKRPITRKPDSLFVEAIKTN
jgi:predicted SAM-dependent methyltransferase